LYHKQSEGVGFVECRIVSKCIQQYGYNERTLWPLLFNFPLKQGFSVIQAYQKDLKLKQF